MNKPTNSTDKSSEAGNSAGIGPAAVKPNYAAAQKVMAPQETAKLSGNQKVSQGPQEGNGGAQQASQPFQPADPRQTPAGTYQGPSPASRPDFSPPGMAPNPSTPGQAAIGHVPDNRVTDRPAIQVNFSGRFYL